MEHDEIAHEIERLRQRWHFLAEAGSGGGAGAVPSTWQVSRKALHWHVVLRNVIEADVDIEVLDEVLVVRGLEGGTLCACLLPVPRPWRAASARIFFREGILEVVFEATDG